MRGRVHNAKSATRDGVDCWIASLIDDDGRFIGNPDAVEECATEVDAIDWCRRELGIRQAKPIIDLDDGSFIRTDLPRRASP